MWAGRIMVGWSAATLFSEDRERIFPERSRVNRGVALRGKAFYFRE